MGGGLFGFRGSGGRIRRDLDDCYGPGWREATVKTLEQELKERGIMPQPGDDQIPLGRVRVPQFDRILLGIFSVILAMIAAVLVYVIVWELTPDQPGEFCPSPFSACERTR